MVDVSASINLPFHHKVQKFSSGIGSPGWSQKKGRKTVVVSVSEILNAKVTTGNNNCFVATVQVNLC